MSEQTSAPRYVELGVIGRPHGVRGAFHLVLYNPDSDLVDRGFRVRVVGSALERDARFASFGRAGKHWIASFEGVEDREGAERLRGARLFVPRSELPSAGEGEYYVTDLIGLVAFEGGSPLGRVTGSRSSGGVEVLTILGEASELEIPFVDEFVEAVDIAAGRMDVLDTAELPRTPLRVGRRERV